MPRDFRRARKAPLISSVEAEPDRLREVTGIGPMRAKRIVGAWAEQKIITVFLHSYGVGTARAVRIFKTYGADAVQVMTENPYRLGHTTGLKESCWSVPPSISLESLAHLDMAPNNRRVCH
jgi:hypothetical protein